MRRAPRRGRSTKKQELESRIDAIDWAGVSRHLDEHGWALLEKLLLPAEASAVSRLYGDDDLFRKHIVMARHGESLVLESGRFLVGSCSVRDAHAPRRAGREGAPGTSSRDA